MPDPRTTLDATSLASPTDLVAEAPGLGSVPHIRGGEARTTGDA